MASSSARGIHRIDVLAFLYSVCGSYADMLTGFTVCESFRLLLSLFIYRIVIQVPLKFFCCLHLWPCLCTLVPAANILASVFIFIFQKPLAPCQVHTECAHLYSVIDRCSGLPGVSHITLCFFGRH